MKMVEAIFKKIMAEKMIELMKGVHPLLWEV